MRSVEISIFTVRELVFFGGFPCFSFTLCLILADPLWRDISKQHASKVAGKMSNIEALDGGIGIAPTGIIGIQPILSRRGKEMRSER
ncbi:MAG: hypothetical protein WA869_08165 [Alloacidobacterium sp.]